MKALRFLIITLLVITSFVPVSCNKGPIQYTFEGIITESVSKSALDGVEIRLYQKLVNNGVASNSFELATSTTSDGGGNYLMAIDREKVTSFRIEFEKTNYFPLEIEVSSADITTEDPNEFSQELEAISWVTFQLKNNFPSDDDHFKLITQTFREDCEGCAVNAVLDFYGPLDTSFTYATTAGEYVKFIYVNVTAASSTFDSIYTTPFETIVYPIVY